MQDGLWIFGYGSLIWNPGFEVAERIVARLDGWHRSFCMTSIHYRGTPEAPGLVLALDRAAGASCQGVAFRAAPGTEAAALAYLHQREMVGDGYHQEHLLIALADGREVQATVYVIDRDHGQYCGALSLEEQAAIIARSSGGRGPNRDYLFATATHLGDLGIGDADLEWLVTRVNEIGGEIGT